MITDNIKTLLADTIEAFLISQGYHWDVEGKDFQVFHDFFGEIYDFHYSQIDPLGEYIRIVSKAREYTTPSSSMVKLNKTVNAPKVLVGDNAVDMCKSLMEINDSLIKQYTELFDLATKEKLQGLANYTADRLDDLAKWNWKILAITNGK